MGKHSVIEPEGVDSSTPRVVDMLSTLNAESQMEASKRSFLSFFAFKDFSHLNRFVILAFYCVAVFFTGCTHWGWDGLQGMLYKSGAYSWQCSASETSRFGNTDYIDCDSRKSTINNLYTVAVASQFAFSFCAGTIIDWAGPKICALLGQFFMLLGWIILAVSSRQFPLYYAGIVLIGMAADTAYFPLLNLSNLFPKRESLILGILGSIRSTSFSIPVFMRMIFANDSFGPQDFWKIVAGYIAIGLVPPIIMTILIIPMQAFSNNRVLDSKNIKIVAQKTAELLQPNPEIIVTSPSEGKETRRRSLRSSQLLSAEVSHLESAEGLAGDTIQNHRRVSRASVLQSGRPVAPSFYVVKDGETAKIYGESTSELIPFKKCLFSLSYVLVILIFCLNLFRAEFFTKSHKDQLKAHNGDVYFLFSICNILSFVPGPIFGAICDRFGVLTAINIMNVSGVGMYAFLMFNHVVSKGIAVLFLMIYISFVLSSLYCYINSCFPVYHFGKLTGIASFIGGMFTLISIPVYSLATSSSTNFLYIDAVMLVCGGIAFLLLLWLHFIKPRSSKVDVDSSKKGVEIVT
ncbi:transporter, major facilitator family protein [Cardiosporidium cionae]|uniref:Transporter, major facilitator family protein n=1 Tax=Cardiosporidium cionae TaxID=476202 RepID=A0ABQ7J813_9APIC|nr:transporter, major facilitator family protein [Cardiosporidium cionae]|eukprot:KAF8820133.1 transporter, major facilitator family protein [Cardiosporidium cionae]